MELKKTVKYDGKIKGIKIVDNNVIDENGEIVDIIGLLSKAYDGMTFDLSTTTKEEEITDVTSEDITSEEE